MKLASLVVSSAKILSAALIFILNMMLARELTVLAYGEFSSWLVYLNFISLVFILGLNTSHLYYYKHGVDNFNKLIFGYTLLIALLMVPAFVFDKSAALLVLAGLCLAGVSIVNSDSQAREKHNIFAIQVIVQNFTILTVMGLAIYYYGVKSGAETIKSYSLAIIIFYAFLLVVMLRLRNGNGIERLDRSFWLYGLKGFSLNFLGILLYSIDILIILYLLGKESVAIYNVAALTAKSLWMVIDSIGLVAFPKMIATTREEELRWVKEAIKISVIFCFIPAIVFLLIGEAFIVNFFGESYRDSIYTAYILIAASFPLVLYKIGSRLAAAKQLWSVTYFVLILSVLLNVALNFLLIPSFGIEGAAFSSLLTYTLCGFLLAYKIKIFSFPWYK